MTEDAASVQRERKLVARRLGGEQQLVHLGLAAWVLRQYLGGKLPGDRASALLTKLCAQLGTAAELWSTIDTAIETGAGEKLDWTNWVLFDKENIGSVSWIDTNAYLWQLFVIVALRELHGNTDIPQLRPSDVVKGAAHSLDAPLWRAFKQVTEDRDGKFGALIGSADAEAQARLKKAISASVSAQEQREIETVIHASLAEEHVSRVAQSIVNAWTKTAVLRQIVDTAGAYVAEDVAPPPGVGHVGYYQFDRKDVYITESHIWSDDWGDHYGRGLAQAENDIVIKAIADHAPLDPSRPEPAGADWPRALRTVLADFGRRYQQPVILLAGVRLGAWRLSGVEGFVRQSVVDSKHLLGRLDGAKVYAIHVDTPAAALIIDFRHFGRWQQFMPKPILETETQIAPGILFGVAPITPAIADDILGKNPELIQTLGGTQQDKKEAQRELQLRVQFRLVESFRFLVQNSDAAVKLPIQERDA